MELRNLDRELIRFRGRVLIVSVFVVTLFSLLFFLLF